MKSKLLPTTMLALALMLGACGPEQNPDSVAANKAASGQVADELPKGTPVPTPISPEELAKQSAESAGYAMKIITVEDPGKPAPGYAGASDTRLIALEIELSNVSSDDKMPVEVTNALITDENNVDYSATTDLHLGELKSGELAKGQLTKGWVGFTVPKEVKLKSVTYRVGLISIVALTVDLPKK
jgi:Domain of unknown function (DUF4352)